MKEDIQLRISEFLDGELSAAEAAQLLKDCQSTEQRQLIMRYLAIGHVMRDEPVLNNDISQSVADAIARLPAEAAKSQGDISQPVKSHWLQDILAGTWLKPALGVAFASSVAVLTIFVNQQQTTNTTVTASAGAATVLADKAAFTPVSIELSHFDRQSVADNDTENKTAVREQLNNYLVSHARSTSGTNYQGMVPYVRVVAYEPAHGK